MRRFRWHDQVPPSHSAQVTRPIRNREAPVTSRTYNKAEDSSGTDAKGEAMYVRISTIEGDPGKIEDAVLVINEKVIPTLEGVKGFTAANFMVDRSTGKLVGVAFWDDESALEGSVEAVNPIRSAVADAMGGKVTSVEPYELVAQSW
jgi:hypothetical protein